jgi:REP element-mobilizing transposase RayT
LIHCVFSTKERRNLIGEEMQPRLWSFLGGIARRNGFKAIAIGGIANHVHVLLSLPAAMPLAKAMQLLKGGSSKWMNENGVRFAWQEGYAHSPWECRSVSRRSRISMGSWSTIAGVHLKKNFWRS